MVGAGQVQKRNRPRRFLRLLVPMLFVGLVFGVILGVKTFLQMDHSNSTETAEMGEVIRPIIANDSGDTFEDLTGEETAGGIPVGEPPMPSISDPDPVGDPGVDPGIAAREMLEEFLEMKSLDERMPFIETQQDEAELVSSVLNGPLPEVQKITVDVRTTDPIEQLIDYYYYVDFADDDGGSTPQTMLVRTRGTQPPKVVVDPFLDLFGGRFARYAKTPVKEAGTFQVIISAGAFCYDEVPAPEKKYTLKILARDDAKEIAKAYFGKASKIGEMLEDESSGLAYGQATPCTVFLRWNIEDDPENPFLEALDIISLNWNP